MRHKITIEHKLLRRLVEEASEHSRAKERELAELGDLDPAAACQVEYEALHKAVVAGKALLREAAEAE